MGRVRSRRATAQHLHWWAVARFAILAHPTHSVVAGWQDVCTGGPSLASRSWPTLLTPWLRAGKALGKLALTADNEPTGDARFWTHPDFAKRSSRSSSPHPGWGCRWHWGSVRCCWEPSCGRPISRALLLACRDLRRRAAMPAASLGPQGSRYAGLASAGTAEEPSGSFAFFATGTVSCRNGEQGGELQDRSSGRYTSKAWMICGRWPSGQLVGVDFATSTLNQG